MGRPSSSGYSTSACAGRAIDAVLMAMPPSPAAGRAGRSPAAGPSHDRRILRGKATPGLPRHPRLVVQQPLLAPQAPGVPAQLAVGPHHAMARHDDRQPVLPVGPAHRLARAGPADARGDRPVGGRRPIRDRPSIAPTPPPGTANPGWIRGTANVARASPRSSGPARPRAVPGARSRPGRPAAGNAPPVPRPAPPSPGDRRIPAGTRPRPVATASIGPSGVSTASPAGTRPPRPAPGGAPKCRAKASRNPLGDSYPLSCATSSTSPPARDQLEGQPHPPGSLIGVERHAEMLHRK